MIGREEATNIDGMLRKHHIEVNETIGFSLRLLRCQVVVESTFPGVREGRNVCCCEYHAPTLPSAAPTQEAYRMDRVAEAQRTVSVSPHG